MVADLGNDHVTVGFNSMMRSQVMNAMEDVDCVAQKAFRREIFLRAIDEVGKVAFSKDVYDSLFAFYEPSGKEELEYIKEHAKDYFEVFVNDVFMHDDKTLNFLKRYAEHLQQQQR